ncbi:MAG: type II secretion system F family protein [Deltaproteobacteria bacterium]|nr:type II secretion system F family protein [Deltaproteobacteria bacterium]
MAKFSYRARDQNGALVVGEAEAVSVAAMQEGLFEQGLIPIAVKEAGDGVVSVDVVMRWFSRVKMDELMVFTRQFYTLFRTGVSIDTILSTLAKQAMGKTFRTAIERIRGDVGRGASLAQAFRQHPRVFDDLYVSMIAAGEEAGILEQTLQELVTLIEKEEAIKKNIKSATLYPKIVVTVLVGAVGVLMTVVIPKFEQFYGHYKADLPFATQTLMAISHFASDFWWLVMLLFVAVFILFKRYQASQSGRYQIDQLRFRFPVFGALNVKIANARFGHILSALYRSGLPMSRSLDVVSRVIGNEAFALEVRQISDDIQRGMGLADAMQQREYFPPVVVETTAIGEQAGSLDEMLTAVAHHFDLEVGHTIKNLTTLLEPLLLIGIFGMVTLMALAIFLPIWNMSSVVTGG